MLGHCAAPDRTGARCTRELGGERARGCGPAPQPGAHSPPANLTRTLLQRVEGLLFALGDLGGPAWLFLRLPSISVLPRTSHLCPAPSTRVAAHWGCAGLVGAVGQGGGEKAETATCGYGEGCEVPARTLPDISSNFPLSPSPLSWPLEPSHLLQRLHNPQQSLQSLHPCGIRPRRAGRRWARPSSASAALPPCLGVGRGENGVLKPNIWVRP